jgi:hypothetical protein
VNTYQKRFLEWPLLLLLIWVEQSLEISFINRFFSFQLLPIIFTYIAFTRDWTNGALLVGALAYLGSSHIGYDQTLYVCVFLWTALTTKVFVETFAMEERGSFIALSLGTHVFSKTLIWLLLRSEGDAVGIWRFVWDTLSILPVVGVVAWALYPLLVAWDNYFEHEHKNTADFEGLRT